MKKETDRGIDTYIEQIGKELKCDRKIKRELLEKLKAELQEAGYSDKGYLDLIRMIGTPEDVSGVLLDAVPQEKIVRNSRKKVFSILLAAALVVIMIIGAVLIILSKDRGNLVTDKEIPTKEKVYRSGMESVFGKNEENIRSRLRRAWGSPAVSREDFDCWIYKDAHLIASYTGKENFFIQVYVPHKSDELEILSIENGRCICTVYPQTSDAVLFGFDPASVVLRQESGLCTGDVITIEYDPFMNYSENITDASGQSIHFYHRVFGISKAVSAAEMDEKSEFERSVESAEIRSTGLVILGFACYFLFAYGIYKLLQHLHYRKTWRAWIPFYHLAAVFDALGESRDQTDRQDRSKDRPSSPELDEDGLLGFISVVGGIEKK